MNGELDLSSKLGQELSERLKNIVQACQRPQMEDLDSSTDEPKLETTTATKFSNREIMQSIFTVNKNKAFSFFSIT